MVLARTCFQAALLGFVAVVIQTILAREALSTAAGHELMLGIVLTGWLLGQALSLKLIWKLAERITVLSAMMLMGGGLVVSFVALRLSSILLLPHDGTMPSLSLLAPLVLACLLPASILTAISFASVYHNAQRDLGSSTLKIVYASEIGGFLIGGLLWTFLAAGNVSHLVIAMLSLITLTVCGSVTGRAWQSWLRMILPIVVAVLVASAYFLYRDQLIQPMPAGMIPIQDVDGRLARWQVGEYQKEYSFYCNGRLTGTTGQDAISDELALLPLSQIETHALRKTRVLYIGMRYPGIDQVFGELKNVSVVYAENDPDYGKLYSLYSDKPEPSIVQGAYQAVSTNKKPWDLIIVSLGPPEGTSLAWAYDRRFIRHCRRNLNSTGVLAYYLGAEDNYNSPELFLLHTKVRSLLESSFDKVAITPPSPVWYFAGRQDSAISLDPKLVAGRIEDYGSRSPYFNEYVLMDRLDQSRCESWQQPVSAVNLTFSGIPLAALRAGMLADDPVVSEALYFLETNSLWAGLLVPFLLLIPLVCLWYARTSGEQQSKRQHTAIAYWCGFTCLSGEIILAWELQHLTGMLYYLLAMLTSVVLAGLFIGITIGRLSILRIDMPDRLGPAITMASLAAIPLIVTYNPFAMAAVASIWLMSLVLPMATGLVLSKVFEGEDSLHAGSLYTADLIGSALGALIIGTMGLLVWGSVLCVGWIMAGWVFLTIAGWLKSNRVFNKTMRRRNRQESTLC